MDENLLETLTIYNRVVNLDDLVKRAQKLYKATSIDDEHFILAYDSAEHRYLAPCIAYINDFDTYIKERDNYRDIFDLLNSDLDYFKDLFGTDIEEVNRLERSALEQDYKDNDFYKMVIKNIFETYKECLVVQEKLTFYFSIDTEEKYFDYVIDLVNKDIWQEQTKVHFFRYNDYLQSKDYITGIDKMTCNYDRVKSGVRVFMQNLRYKKETFDHLRTFILFCNLYPRYYDRNWFMNYEYATGLSSKKLKRKLKQFKKYLIKLAKNNK